MYAFRGLRFVWISEVNFRIHVYIACSVILFGILLKITLSEWLWVGFSIGLVLSMEIINSAIETIIDYMFPHFHEVAGKAKDIAAAAVLISALLAAFIGMIIFVPKVAEYLLS